MLTNIECVTHVVIAVICNGPKAWSLVREVLIPHIPESNSLLDEFRFVSSRSG
jgi:hypothetical protein